MSWLYQPLLPGGAQQQGEAEVVFDDAAALASGLAVPEAAGAVYADASGLTQGSATASARPAGFGDAVAQGAAVFEAAGVALANAAALTEGRAAPAAAAASDAAASAVSQGAANPEAAGPDFQEGAGLSAGAAVFEAVSAARAGAAGLVDASAEPVASAVITVDAGAETQGSAPGEAEGDRIFDAPTVQGGSGGGGFWRPPEDVRIARLKKAKRKPRTHVIKVGEWPAEDPELTVTPLPDDGEIIDLDAVVAGLPDGLAEDQDEEEALLIILALAA